MYPHLIQFETRSIMLREEALRYGVLRAEVAALARVRAAGSAQSECTYRVRAPRLSRPAEPRALPDRRFGLGVAG